MSNKKKDNNTAPEPIGNFKDRIALLMKDESYGTISEKTGLSRSNLQAMVRGQIPGIDKAATLAIGLGVRLDWLILGRGPVYEVPDAADVSGFFEEELSRKSFVDLETIKTIIAHFEAIRDPDKDYSPAQVANTIALMSVLFTGSVEDHDPKDVLQMLKNL